MRLANDARGDWSAEHGPRAEACRLVNGLVEARVLVALGDVQHHVVREDGPRNSSVVGDLDSSRASGETRPQCFLDLQEL